MESILESYLNDFSDNYSFGKEDQSKLFEHFVNYTTIPKLDNTRESIEKVNVGGISNPGIDGIAIIVNDHLVTTKEEVDYFSNALGRLEVEFYFIQAKTSSSFSMAEISSFARCIEDFFSDKLTFEFNDETKSLFEIKQHIFSLTLKMPKNPNLNIIFSTGGQWTSDKNLEAMKEKSCAQLHTLGYFSNIFFKAYDRDLLKSAYRELQNSITRTITFSNHTILPEIESVDEAFIGMLPGIEFLKIISNDQEEMLRNIFYDNVRDFQGFNTVNNEIKETLENDKIKDKFSLLNNGVTIVAKKLNKTGTKFTISDYQIVNGCQTSHVMYYNRNSIDNTVFLPVKIIVTQSYDLMSKIIRANNRQTTVGNEAFEILSPFHKYLEDLYIALSKKHNFELLYERRSNQYEPMNLTRQNYITLSSQIKSYVSMYFSEPHNATQRYFGELLKIYKSKIFVEGDLGNPYYASGLAINAIERLFYEHKIPKKYRRFKYHLLMLIRVDVVGEKIPPLNSKKIVSDSELIINTLLDESKLIKIVNNIIDKIDKALLSSGFSIRNAHGDSRFCDVLLPKHRSRKTLGKISYYDSIRGFGFIEVKGVDDVWFHISDYHTYISKIPQIGELLSIDLVDNEKGNRAINIVLSDS